MSKHAWLAALLIVCGVGARVHAACVGTVNVSATPVAFLTYDPLSGSPKDATGTVSIGCSILGLLPNTGIALSSGLSGSFATRTMKNGNASLRYNLFTDATRQTIWGDGSPGTSLRQFQALLALGTFTFTVYGRIPPGQDAPSGAYTDVITVTVEF